jgi:aminoglycoside phosphotransferase (APT) family kinase protein
MASEELAALLQHCFPELEVAPLRVLDVGFGSTVVETAGGIVFRIARHARAAEGHAREWELLPQLVGRLPATVPEPRWRIEPNDEFPFGGIAYRKLAGEPATASDGSVELARDVAGFLSALHALRDLKAQGAREDFLSLRESIRPALAEVLSRHEFDRLERWWEELLGDTSLGDFVPALRHGDLWYENLLVVQGRLAGVVDWSRAAFSDPAEDFAPLRHFGDAFADAALDAYGADRAIRRRADRHWELRELFGIRHCIELDDAAELADSIRKLRAGPILADRRGE